MRRLLGCGQFYIIQPWRFGVLVGNQRLADTLEWPRDGQPGIIPAHAALAWWTVKVSRFVQHTSCLRKHDEAVPEALRNPEELQVLAAQVEPCPLPKLRRTGAKVDGNIPDVAVEHAHQLALRLNDLIVQASQHTTLGE